MSERQLYLKPPEDGGSVRYYHTGYGVGASRRNPYVTCSDDAAAALLDTGKFEEVESVELADDDDDADAGIELADADTDAESEADADAEAETEAENTDADAADAEADAEDEGEDEDAGVEICGTEMSDGDICERPVDECPYH